MSTLSIESPPESSSVSREFAASPTTTAVVTEIVALHGEIMGAARTSLDKAIRIGELLSEQKASLKHGQWLPWIESNLPFSQQTVSNYVRVFENRDKLPTVGNLELTDAYRLLSDGNGKEKTASVADLGEAYRLLAPSGLDTSTTGDEIPTPEELVDAGQTTIEAIRFLCDSELAEVENIIASANPETTDEQERFNSIRALAAGQKKALAWQNYWASFTIHSERRAGQAIIQMRELLSADPWPELIKLYPWLVGQKEKCPEVRALWNQYPDAMMVLDTARAFHVMDTGRSDA